ncbi:hypothetical protein Tco_0194993 [Tanacetum coccineum]
MDIRMSRLEKALSEKNVTTPATVKAVKEVCFICGSNHNFNNCPLTRNEFPILHDNIHQFQQTVAVGNFVQRNSPNLANQMRPPGFNQPNVQNNQGNQSRYPGNNFNSNQNRGNNFNHQNNQGHVFQPPTNQPPVYQIPPYQAPMPEIQGVSKMDFENYVKANDAEQREIEEIAITTVDAECSAIIKNISSQEARRSVKNFLSHVLIQELDGTKHPFKVGSNTIPSVAYLPSSSPMKTSDSTFEKFTDEFTLPNSLPPATLILSLKKTIRMSRLSLFLPSHLLHRKKVNLKLISPGIDLTLPPTLEISSSNPTSPTLTGEKDFKKDLTVAFDSTESSILAPPLLDSDSPFIAELSASITLNSLGNEDKVFKPGILVYHAIHDKNLITLEKNLRENISFGTLLFLKEPSSPRPPPEPPDVEKCLELEAGILITKVFKGVSKPHDFMPDILVTPTFPTLVSDLSFIHFSPSGVKTSFLT